MGLLLHGKVIEMSDFDRPGVRASRQASARYYGRITAAATARPVTGQPFVAPIRCRRRPSGRPCGGNLRVLRPDVPPEIRWWCTSCGDRGVIRGWQGTSWDLVPPPRFEREAVALLLDQETFRVLEAVVSRADPGWRPVAGACLRTDDQILVTGNDEDMRALRALLRRRIATESRPPRRRRLLRILETVSVAVRSQRGPLASD